MNVEVKLFRHMETDNIGDTKDIIKMKRTELYKICWLSQINPVSVTEIIKPFKHKKAVKALQL